MNMTRRKQIFMSRGSKYNKKNKISSYKHGKYVTKSVTHTRIHSPVRVCLFPLSEASITAEASLVCPVFIFAMMTLMGILSWFNQAEDVQRELEHKAYIMEKLMYAKGEENDIDIPYVYCPVKEVPIPELVKPLVYQHIVLRPFSGVSTIEGAEKGEIVYVTPNGSVYHDTETCTYIKKNIREISAGLIDSVRNEDGCIYYPCNKCIGKEMPDTVYVTLYGNKYHSDKLCKALSKNVYPVYKSDVPWMRKCSKCGG